MSASNPISPKVIAAASGAGAGVVVSTALLWLVGGSLFGAGLAADTVEAAVAAVPSPLAAVVYLLITVAGAAIPGYSIGDPKRVVDPPLSTTPSPGEYESSATVADYDPDNPTVG